MKIIFLGAPGAGKGTQAEVVSRRLGIPSISTGAIIREAIKNETAMGLAAKQYISVGALVPDEVVIGIIRERLADADCANGYILDGFPRTVPQAEALDKMGIALDAVVSIEVPDEAIVERMSGRRVCDSCGASYRLKYHLPKDGKTCDHCGTPLSIRRDDAPEVVQSRLKVYHEVTEPLREVYAKKGNLKIVEGQPEIEETTKLMLRTLGVS
jgi:adenylate kinase